jgi:predicted nucleic acid-binding protein
MSRWVVDTSPLIFLAKLDRLDLLRKSADEILVPAAVVEEVRAYPDDAGRKIEDALGSWLREEKVEGRRIVEVLLVDLDFGEAEVIALSRERAAERVVMDDLDGRRLARRLGLEPVGTLGLLLVAKLRGELGSLREEIERLEREGFRVSPALIEAVLRTAGEGPENAE